MRTSDTIRQVIRHFVSDAVLVVGLLVCADAARAQDLGNMNCAAWVHEALQGQTPRRHAFEYWLLGYLAGARAAASQPPLSHKQAVDVVQRLEGYCGDKPLMLVRDAALVAASARAHE